MSKEVSTQDSANPELNEFYKKFIEGKDVNGIEDVIRDLNLIADSKRKEEYTTLYEEFQSRVIAIGFENLRDFMVAIETQGIIKPERAPRRKVEVRFRDPENDKNTWTGRGKQPRWIQAYVEQGRKLEEFEVTPPKIESPE